MDSHYVEHIKVVFAAIRVFIPLHGAFEGVHRKGALVGIWLTGINPKLNLAAIHGFKGAFFGGHKVCNHKRKKVARFWVRVVPHGKMPATCHIANFFQIPV